MSKYARDKKLVERGHNNAATVRARNRKASKQFDRWFNGLLVWHFYGDHRWHWQIEPTGRGLIHKGRKP
jgi:hypothetical protein